MIRLIQRIVVEEILADVGQSLDGDLDAGLLLQLPPERGADVLAQFDAAARQVKLPPVAIADQQRAPLVRQQRVGRDSKLEFLRRQIDRLAIERRASNRRHRNSLKN